MVIRDGFFFARAKVYGDICQEQGAVSARSEPNVLGTHPEKALLLSKHIPTNYFLKLKTNGEETSSQ